MAVGRDRLVAFLDELLDARRGRDFGPNGLQVEGRAEIRKIATGVSACQDLFERAAEAGADAVLVHHGILWDFGPQRLVGFHHRRIATLVRNDMNLIAYHLPLDRHPELGNNAIACRRLGLGELEPFGMYEGLPVGYRGRYAAPIDPEELVRRCADLFGQPPIHLGGGRGPIRALGMISGGAQRELYQAIDAGLDAYVTGEAAEWVMNVAREAGIHYLACGHYATETLGIRALGEHIAKEFGVDAEFIDVPNSI
jgi:dinuclear metal center YbgI/SA1388 family protein